MGHMPLHAGTTQTCHPSRLEKNPSKKSFAEPLVFRWQALKIRFRDVSELLQQNIIHICPVSKLSSKRLSKVKGNKADEATVH